VVAVVQADADDLAGPGHGGADPHTVPRHLGQLPRGQGSTQPLDAAAGEEFPVEVVRHRPRVEPAAVPLDGRALGAGLSDPQEPHALTSVMSELESISP
jgi:hypothetical protein